ncbi:MAG: D-glycero-alpha-D-manno-heptose-7-phosphate [Rhodospirillaceae bacterium]|nr:MAG: D-glycero-alpha-D-manno-heptose-7-phosphate [Rhodospirillaceae bacterium]TNC97423.1 MAG: D-glycero-alpha-D-manno-heptose-7-phosphate kinase [Stygiobacter sp.]
MDGLEKLLIPCGATMEDAMRSLRASGRGITIVQDGNGRALGILTDGDIRNALMDGGTLQSPVRNHMNRGFVSVREGARKEETLKLLDSRIRAIPVLDGDGQPVGLVTTGYLEPQRETYARAKAPVRVSLAGGGTDFTHYFMEHGGVSLTASISLYSHVELRKRADTRIRIFSQVGSRLIEADNLSSLVYDGDGDLLKAGIRVMKPDFGFDLWVDNDFLPGSGLGGSASVLAGVIGAFNEMRDDKLDSYSIAEHAFEAERIELDISGGWQDQYSTVFGGFNFIEFDDKHNTVTPLRLQPGTLQELEERFLLCYSGAEHLGEKIQSENRQPKAGDPEKLGYAAEIKAIALEMKAHLLRGNLNDFGAMLDATWQLKKRINPLVSSGPLDDIYQLAMDNGAEGGRLLGTGGGGYFLFFVKPFRRYDVVAALRQHGLTVSPLMFDRKGLQSWMARS